MVAICYALFLCFLSFAFVDAQDFKVEELHKIIGGENIGLITEIKKHGEINYIKAFHHKKNINSWYKYEYNKSIKMIKYEELPLELKRATKTNCNGLLYMGKYYNFQNNELYALDTISKINKKIQVKHPKEFKRPRSIIKYNNRLFFVAWTKDYGEEVFSYSSKSGIEVHEVANQHRIGKGSGKKYAVSSYPNLLQIWNKYLIFSAKDGSSAIAGRYGRELYKLDKNYKISLIKDVVPGNDKKYIYSTNFFKNKHIFFYSGKGFMELTNAGDIIPFNYNELNNHEYEIRNILNTGNYLILTARTQHTNSESNIHVVLIEQNGKVHLFQDYSDYGGVIWKDYYIFNGLVSSKIGNEPYALNLKTKKIQLLKDIRKKPYYNPILGINNYGSNPTIFYETEKEVLFSGEIDTVLNSWTVFSIKKPQTKSKSIKIISKDISFGKIHLNKTKTKLIEFSCTGTTDISFSGIDITSHTDIFKVDYSSIPAILKAGQKYSFKIEFKPKEMQVYTAKLKIKTNADDGDLILDIMGEGYKSSSVDSPIKNIGFRVENIIPNPAINELTIYFHLNVSARYTISLLDITGRKVGLSFKRNYTKGKHFESISVSNLPSGIYFLYLDNNIESVSKKFIIKK